MNLSGTFLKHHHIDQLHSRNCLRLKNGLLVPIHTSPSVHPSESASLLAVISQKTRLPPMSITHLQVKVPRLTQNTPTDGLIEGSSELVSRKGVMPWNAAMVAADQFGCFRAGIVNPTSQYVKVKAGELYGVFNRVCAIEEQERTPWRIAVIETEPSVNSVKGNCDKATNKPTVREKMAEIVNKMREERGKEESDKEKIPSTLREKTEWLTREFRLHESPFLKDDSVLMKKVTKLLIEYWDTISVQGEFGQTELVEHEINTGNAPPIKCRPRPINPILEKDLKKQLDDNLKKKVIEPSQSPWSFPLVAAPKKNGKIRWCVDYRKLNQITVRVVFPLPHINDNLSRLSEAQVFSTLDGSGAFHVIPVKEEDRPKTAFSTPYGLYHYKRMPFGLCNGPASYSRLVQLALQGIPLDVAIPYLDDIIVISKDARTHLANLETILKVHRKAGLKLQPSKCHIFRKSVEYLGHIVSKKGIAVIPRYVKAVQDWKLPKTRSDFRVFLGKVGYYRRYIKNYSKIAAPMTDVSGKGSSVDEKQPIEATPPIKKAFEALKKSLLSAPILAYPRFHSKEPFILDTDWSQGSNAIAGVLSQVQDGKERVIAYGGKKLSKAQQKYDPFKGELTALLHFVRTWRYYLQYRPFLLRVDHAPLTFMKSMQPQDRHTTRMLSVLADFDFKIVHRKGTSHGNADGISRAPHLRDAPDAEEDVATDEEDQYVMSMFLADISGRNAESASQLYSKETMVVLQDDDPSLSVVKRAVETRKRPESLEVNAASPETRHYFNLFEHLFIGRDGLLRYQPPGSSQEKSPLVCLPQETWDKFIQEVHRTGGHCGINSTVERISRSFYFPRMKAEVQDSLEQCLDCRRKHQSQKDQRHTLISVLTGYPFQRLSVDYVGPLHTTRGKRFIFTCRDHFSKWVEACATPAATAAHAIEFLVNEVVKRFGVPESIHSDQGSHFTARMLRETARALGIRTTTTPAYNPKSNITERWHRDLGEMTRALASQTGSDWVQCLPAAVMATNTNVHSGTKYSPFRLLYGRDPPLPLDIIFRPPGHPQTEVKSTNASEYAADVKRRVQEAFKYARENLKMAVERRRQSYLKAKQGYQSGDRVWLLTPVSKPHVARKLQDHWSGPWLVLNKLSEVLYEIKAPEHWKIMKHVQVVSVDRLAPYPKAAVEERLAPDDSDLEMVGDEFVERPEVYHPPEFEVKSRPAPPPRPTREDSDEESDDEVFTTEAQRTPLLTQPLGSATPATTQPPIFPDSNVPMTPFSTPATQSQRDAPARVKRKYSQRDQAPEVARRLFHSTSFTEPDTLESSATQTSNPLPPLQTSQEEEETGTADGTAAEAQYEREVARAMTLRQPHERRPNRDPNFEYY